MGPISTHGWMDLKRALTGWAVRKLPDECQRREATLDSWIADGYDRDAVIQALAIVCRAFRVSETDGPRLRSGDQVWALYRHFYPRSDGWRRFFDMPVDELDWTTWNEHSRVVRRRVGVMSDRRDAPRHPRRTAGHSSRMMSIRIANRFNSRLAHLEQMQCPLSSSRSANDL